MSRLRVALLGEPADLRLAGAEGSYSWGDVLAGDAGDALTVELVRSRPAAGTALAWHGGRACVLREGQDPWRRLPWPAGTQACELALPAHERALVAGAPALADPIHERLRERRVAVDRRDRIDLEALADASVVCVPVLDGAPPPPEAMAVLAAGRILVTGRCEPDFGLQPGIDCYMESSADAAAQRVEAAVRWPEAFALIRALGRNAGARHRADVLLHRLAVDAALGVD